MKKYSLVKTLLMPILFILSSCEKGEVVKQEYYSSPDGQYVVEQLHTEAGLNTLAIRISIGTPYEREEGILNLVFYGLEYNSDVHWKTNDELIIVFCGQAIRKSENFYSDGAGRKVDIRHMTGEELNRAGKPVCGYDKDGNYNGY